MRISRENDQLANNDDPTITQCWQLRHEIKQIRYYTSVTHPTHVILPDVHEYQIGMQSSDIGKISADVSMTSKSSSPNSETYHLNTT